MTYKPDNYNCATPYLIVDGAQATLQFLEAVFDARRLRIIPRDGGKLVHAEVRIDDSVVMLCDPPPGGSAVPSHVHVYVPDVDATFRKAMQAGATSVQEPVKGDDADKRGGFTDPGGTTWWVGTQVE